MKFFFIVKCLSGSYFLLNNPIHLLFSIHAKTKVICMTLKAWSNEDASGWESQLSLSFDRQLSTALMHSHQLWARLTGHESRTRVDENYKRLNKMADVSKRLSHTIEKPEALAISKSLPIIRRSKKENINRGSNAEQKQGNRKKTLVNSHVTLTACLTEQWELRKHSCKLSPANSHRLSSSFHPGFKDDSIAFYGPDCMQIFSRVKHENESSIMNL